MDVPQSAVERYEQLESAAGALHAAYMSTHEEATYQRGEAARLESILRTHHAGKHLQIEPNGAVFYVGLIPGQPRVEGHVRWYPDARDVRQHLELTLADQQTARLVLAARQRVAAAEARKAELSESLSSLRGLAEACRKELERRGWTRSGIEEMRL